MHRANKNVIFIYLHQKKVNSETAAASLQFRKKG